jgi:hypothetical protein
VGDAEVLVSIAGENAGVYRDDDGYWLTGRLGEGGTLLTGYQPSVEGLAERRTVAGGRLPPGAIGSEVVDDLGNRHPATAANGAWILALDQPTRGNPPPVRHFDEDGVTVAAPLPDDWPRAPVPDAREQCPACGGSTWDEVTPLDESRGMSGPRSPVPLLADDVGEPPDIEADDWTPTPFLVCRTCGHEESAGTILQAVGGEGDPDEALRIAREFEHRQREQEREALASIEFPIFAPDGLEATLNGWGGLPGATNRVTVTHWDGMTAHVSVETQSGDALYATPGERVLEALEDVLPATSAEPSEPPTGSEAAVKLWFDAREREERATTRELMARVARRQAEMLVDGASQPVEIAAVEGSWAAAFDRDGIGVTVTSTTTARLEEVRLVTLDDPLESLRSMFDDLPWAAGGDWDSQAGATP